MSTLARVKRYVDVAIVDPRWSPDGGALTWALERPRWQRVGALAPRKRPATDRPQCRAWRAGPVIGARWSALRLPRRRQRDRHISQRPARVWSARGADPLAWSHDGLLAAPLPPYEGRRASASSTKTDVASGRSPPTASPGRPPASSHSPATCRHRTASQAHDHIFPGRTSPGGRRATPLYYESDRLGTRRINMQSARTHASVAGPFGHHRIGASPSSAAASGRMAAALLSPPASSSTQQQPDGSAKRRSRTPADARHDDKPHAPRTRSTRRTGRQSANNGRRIRTFVQSVRY